VLDPGDDPPDQRDVAIQLARRVPDHGVEFGPGAGIG